MSLGREINDFLGAWGRMEDIWQKQGIREYYAKGGKKGSYDPNKPPPGWGTGTTSTPGLFGRIGNAIGIGGGSSGTWADSHPPLTETYEQGGLVERMRRLGAPEMSFPMSEPAPGVYPPPEAYPEYLPPAGPQSFPPGAMQQRMRALGAPQQSFPMSTPPEAGPPAPLSGDMNEGAPMEQAPGARTAAYQYAPQDLLPPLPEYLQRAATAAPPSSAGAPARQPAIGGPAPAARKALTDQTRTEAYNPDLDGPLPAPAQATPAPASPAVGGTPAARPTPQSGDMASNPSAGLSTNNARDDLAAAIDGGLRFAQKTFHLDGSNVGVGSDPRSAKGAQALMQGVGAAPPQMVQAVNERVNANLPPQIVAQLGHVRSLETLYRWRSANGDTEGANKAAFELMQYSAGVAAQMGGRAMQQFRAGDVPGATKTVQEAYNQIPDGRHLEVNGSTATVVDTRTGKPVDQFSFTPEQVLNAALGLSNRSLYWQVLAQRAATVNAPKGTQRSQSQQELDLARADYYRARTGQVGKPSGGRGRGGATGPSPAMNSILERLASIPRPDGSSPPMAPAQVPQDNTPPQGGGDLVDDDEDEERGGRYLEAPPDLKVPAAPATAPQSVLRLKPPKPGSGSNPPPTPAGGSGEPASPSGPAAGVGSRPSTLGPGAIAAPPKEPFDPDAVPKKEVFRPEQSPPEPAPVRPFDEPAPTGVPKELYELQREAIKLGTREGGPRIVAQVNREIKAWQDHEKGYASRKKAYEAAEAKRFADERKAAAEARKEAARAAQGYNLNQRDVQAIETNVKDAYKAVAEEKPEAVAPLGNPGRVHEIAIDLAQRNKLSAEQALRLVGELTAIETEDPKWRSYKLHGRDPLGNVVMTLSNGRPLHVTPHVFQSITAAVKERQALEEKAKKEKAKQAEKDAKGGVGAAVDKLNKAAMKPGDRTPSDATQRNLAAPYLRAPRSPTDNAMP